MSQVATAGCFEIPRQKTEVYNGQIEVRKRVTKRGFFSGISGDTLNLEDGKQWYFV